MTTADQIRATIRAALQARDLGAVEVVTAMRRDGRTSVNRTYLADFVTGKKASLSFDFAQDLADFLGLDVQELRVKKHARIEPLRPGARPHLYVTEHMEHRGWDDARLAERIDGIPVETVQGWRRAPQKLVDWQVQALLHAFGMEDIAELARPPAPRQKASPRATKRRAAR